MWDGLRLPIACKEHRHVDAMCDIKSKKKRKRGSKGLFLVSFSSFLSFTL